MKKPKIVYTLGVIETTVVFCIHEMDERFRNLSPRKTRTFSPQNYKGRTVCSDSSPQLSISPDGELHVVYLWGSTKGADSGVSTTRVETREKANKIVEQIHEILQEWAEECELLKEEEEETPPLLSSNFESKTLY